MNDLYICDGSGEKYAVIEDSQKSRDFLDSLTDMFEDEVLPLTITEVSV